MARLRYNGLTATLGAELGAAGTTITFGAALTHAGGTNVPTISGSDYIPLAILDATTGALLEIVHLTAYTTGATTGTITRAQESTTAGIRASGSSVVNGPTAADFSSSSTADPAWIAPTLTNSWVNFGGTAANAGYRKDAEGRVHLRGLIKSGTLGAAAFTLPTGYQPASDLYFAAISNDAFGEVVVTAAGQVKPTTPASTNWVSLTGLQFYTD